MSSTTPTPTTRTRTSEESSAELQQQQSIFDGLTYVSLGLDEVGHVLDDTTKHQEDLLPTQHCHNNNNNNITDNSSSRVDDLQQTIKTKVVTTTTTTTEEEEQEVDEVLCCEDDDEYVLIDSSEGTHVHYSDIMANYGQKYYSLVHQQDIFLHGSFVETVIPFTHVPSILSTMHSGSSSNKTVRHAPYGTYRILIQLASVLHVRSFEHLASVSVRFSPNNRSTIVVDEKVRLLKSEHFNSDSAFWMSSAIRIPSLYYDTEQSEQANEDLLWRGVTVSLAPVKQSGVVMQPKYKFVIRLISESEIHSQTTLTIPPHSTSPISLLLDNNSLNADSLGAFTVVVTDRSKSGQAAATTKAMGAFMGDWLQNMKLLHNHSPLYQVVIKSEAMNVHDEMGREYMTPLFPVYKYHLGIDQKMRIKCTITPLQKTGRKPTKISIMLLKVPFSEERVRECEIISSTTHMIVASLEQYKDGQILEDNLPTLNKYLESESFHSSFLQADPVAIRSRAISIVEQKNQLVSRAKQLECFCNGCNYADSCESGLDTLKSDLSKFQFAFSELKQAEHLVKQLSQRIALRRQLSQRLSYVQNMVVGFSGVHSTVTIDVIYREHKVLHDLHQALMRAFNDNFSVCEAVANDVQLLESFIAVLEVRRQELIRLAIIQKEQLEKSKAQMEQSSTKNIDTVTCNVITESEESVVATTDVVSIDIEDMTSERTENDIASISEETTDRSFENVRSDDVRTEDDQHNFSPITDEEAKRKKKRKKKRVANIEDRVVSKASQSPTQVLQHSKGGRDRSLSNSSISSTSTSSTTLSVEAPSHFSSLDNGQVIHEMHQCLKQLMRIGAANPTTTTSSDEEISRLQIPRDNLEAQNLIDNLVYLVVRYVLLQHRISKKSKWFGKKSSESEQFVPAISIIRGMGDPCLKYLETFEASVEQIALQEEAACEQFVRWSLSNHALPIIIKSMLSSTKYVSKFYTKSSLLISPSFQDEFICVLELLSQMQL